jgi:hypothetical protein
MATNPKQKGNTFERTVANLLSESKKDFLGVEKGFRRNSDSGSFFGGKNIDRVDTHLADYQNFGDLLCPKNFRFSIECKHYKVAVTLNSIMIQNSKQLDNWIQQVEVDANNSKKLPMLIVKYDNVEPIMFSKECFGEYILKYKEYFGYNFKKVLAIENKELKFFN